MKAPRQFAQLTEHRKLLILSLLTGLLAGLASSLLVGVIELIGNLVAGSVDSGDQWLYLVLPGAGMLISLLLLRYVVRDDIGHGVTKALLAVSRGESKIKPHNTWSSLLTSSVTIGLGGSVGAEAPIVYTGAAIGSNLGRVSGLSYRGITILLGCGAAGAVAGIFKAPLAGVLFVMEILLFNISMNSMLPLLISSISAAVVAYIFRGQAPMFAADFVDFRMANVPYYLILGLVCAACALYFTRTTLWMEEKLKKFSRPYLKWVLCAAVLGLLIFLFPPLYGQGYDSLSMLLSGDESGVEGGTVLSFLFRSPWGVPVFFALVFFCKVLAMTLTNAGGGVGGTFGPTLFAGAILGFVVARVVNLALSGSGVSVPEQNFVLVGMAALMASVMQAPMTAIFLIAELLLTSTVSFGVVRIFERYSIYTKRIAMSGDLLTHDNDQAVVALLDTRSLVRDKYPRIQDTATFAEIAKITTESTAAVFPVLDSKGRFEGLIDMDTFRRYLTDPERNAGLYAYNVMEQPQAYVYADEKMSSVLRKFDVTGAWRIPVVEKDRTYLGFISKSRILMAYRSELQAISVGDE